MTSVVHGPAAAWATAHRNLTFLIALVMAVVAAAAVILVVQLATDSTSAGSVAPVDVVAPACADAQPMTGTFC